MAISITSANRTRNKLALVAAIFVALNIFAGAALNLVKFDRLQAFHHGWIYWALNGYHQRRKPADVVLIGSSLLQHIIYEGEADYLDKQVNALQHNRSLHLEDRLSRTLSTPVSSYAIAIGGMHASDASLITSAMLAKKPPAVLIYTIAPRDLLDNMLPSPSATDTFQLMSRLSDTADVGAAARYSKAEKFDYAIESALNKTLSLYDYRKEITTDSERAWRRTLGSLFRADMFAAQGGPLSTSSLGLTIPEFDFSGTIGILPHDPRAQKGPPNRLCYLCTYQPFRPKLYNNQLMFLRRMLNSAKANDIKTVLVNMPLRNDNLTAMVPHFYEIYCNDLKKAAGETGAQLIDMQHSGLFHDSDFIDTVHLNGAGAIKLVDQLADRLQPAVLTAVENRARRNNAQLAEREGAAIK